MRYKDTANREQRAQTCLRIYAEMRRIFYKDTANREQRAQTCLRIYAEMRRIFYKSSTKIKLCPENLCISEYIFIFASSEIRGISSSG